MRAQVTIRIKENPGTSFAFRDLVSPNVANISKVSSIFDNNNRGTRGFQLSKSKDAPLSTLDGSYGYFASGGYEGYVSSEICDEVGNFDPALALSFYIIGNAPDHVYVMFDAVAQEYATHFTLQSDAGAVEVNNNTSTICRVPVRRLKLPSYSDGTVITLFINTWNKPHKSAKVTLISGNFVGVFVGSDLQSFTCSENMLDDQMSINPGIIAQYADVSIYDRLGYIHHLAEEDVLQQEADVIIEAVDADGTLHTLGTYQVSAWDVQATSSTVSVDCTDVTATLEHLDVPRQPATDRTLHDMLVLLFQYIRNAPWMYYDADVERYCKKIVTPDCWFPSGSVYALLNKICSLGMLRIYWRIDTYVVARCL